MLRFRAEKLHQSRLFPLGALTRGLAGEVLTEMAELTESGCVGFGQAEVPLASTRCCSARCSTPPPLATPCGCARRRCTWAGRGRQRCAGHAAGPVGRARGGETIALQHHFELLKTTGARVHLCRLSSAAGVDLVRAPRPMA